MTLKTVDGARPPAARDVTLKRLVIIGGVLAVAVILVIITALLILNVLNGTRHDSVAVAPGVSVATFATLAGESAYPVGIGRAPDGTLYLSAFGQGIVYKLAASGALTPWVQPGSGLTAPGALTVAPDGSVYIVDSTTANLGTSAGTIKTITTDGKVHVLDNGPLVRQGLSYLSHLAFDAQGNLYVTLAATGEVWRYAAGGGTGMLWLKLASVGGNAAQPTGIAFDKAHNAMIVSDAASGTIYRAAITAGGSPDQPLVLYRNAGLPAQALAFDDGGRLLVVAWAHDDGQLARLEADGAYTLLAQGFRDPSDLVATGGKIYVVNSDLAGLIPLRHANPPFTVDVVSGAS